MPPKRNEAASQNDDIAAIKDTCSRLEYRFNACEKFMAEESRKTTTLIQKIGELEKMSREKDLKIRQLEERVDELEQYSRREDLIISGLVPDITYAEVLTGEGTENERTRNIRIDKVEDQVVEFLKSRTIPLEKTEITACHTLGKKRDDGTQNIIVRFLSRKTKSRILMSGENLKGTRVFINEHLTRKNADFARAARQLKKDGKITKTWTRDCKVYVKVLRGNTTQIKSSADLRF